MKEQLRDHTVPLGKVLIATDFSDDSEAVFQYALYLAKLQHGKLLILHVITRDVAPVYLIPAMAAGPLPEMEMKAPPFFGEYETEIKQKMFELVQRSRKEGLIVEDILSRGKPAQEILRIALERQADLIILGNREKSELARLLRGNISEKVARKARCPVLVIRSPQTGLETGTRQEGLTGNAETG